MSDTEYPLDNGKLPEFEAAIAPEPRRYEIEGEEVVVFRDRLWRRLGSTRNPRAVATADAVYWEQALLTVHCDGPVIELQHHNGGIMMRLLASERTAAEFELFEEVLCA